MTRHMKPAPAESLPPQSEHDAQSAVKSWADAWSIVAPEAGLLFAVPNGARLTYRVDSRGRRYSPEAQRLKAEGLRPGVPDLVLPVARHGYHGLFIELKVGRNSPSPEQAAWLDRLSEQGYLAVAAWGADEAIEIITEYLGLQT